ncbi:MAG: 3-oxoacyl-ACP reductase FabG [Clostridia bacterium]|nr:3-oxoacyl-ACP reductase FabG [Clostridia bacterium]
MNRKIIITGGSRGIGAAMVKKFALEGDKVAFIYKSCHEEANKLTEELGAMGICADIGSASECKRAASLAIEKLGGVDVLINNAGIASFGLFTETADEDFEKMISVNLSAPFYLSRECAKEMIKKQSGRIINVGSMWGITGASCEVPYSAAKAGIIGMTKAMAKELGPSSINVNCICPGVIETDMNAHLSEADLKALADETPLCRIGKPDEVAELALFLASNEAAFITGQIISVDGGFAI